MSLRSFLTNFALFTGAPNGPSKLRMLILQLGIRGMLIPQDPTDEPAEAVSKRISDARTQLVEKRLIKGGVPVAPIKCEDIPFAIPDSWNWERVERVFYSISPGKNKIKTSEINKSGRFPVIDQGQRYIAGFVDDDTKLIRIPGPVIVFGDHTCELKFVDFDFVAGAEGVKILRPIEIDERYFYRVAQTFDVRGNSYSRHYKFFVNNLFPLPPLKEQNRIASKIDELLQLCDELQARQQAKRESRIRLNTAIVAPLNQAASLTPEQCRQATTRLLDNFDILYDSIDTVGKLRSAILQLALQGKLVSQDRHDESAALLLERIGKQRCELLTLSELKKVEPQRNSDQIVLPFGVPVGWKWTRLGQVSTKLGAGSTPLGGKNVYQRAGVKFLRSQNVWNDGLRLNNVAYISEMVHTEMNGTHVQDGDILLNITGASIGRSSVVPEHFGEANVSQHVAIIRLVDKRLRFFIHACMISPYIQDMIMQTQVGISREGLSMRNLKDFLLPIPPLAEQQRIVAKVNQLMSLCDDLEAKLLQAEADSEKLMNTAVRHVLDCVHGVSKISEEVFA